MEQKPMLRAEKYEMYNKARMTSKPGGATTTLQRNAAYFCLSFARLSLAWLFALGRVQI
jgi:hypothetical protein